MENHLRKIRYSREDILRRLSEINDFNDYFNNLEPAVLADLVVGLVPRKELKKYENSFNGLQPRWNVGS